MQPFVESLSKCPKHGLHNPFKSPERFVAISLSFCILLAFFPSTCSHLLWVLFLHYNISFVMFKYLRFEGSYMNHYCRYLLYGDISAKAGYMLSLPEVIWHGKWHFLQLNIVHSVCLMVHVSFIVIWNFMVNRFLISLRSWFKGWHRRVISRLSAKFMSLENFSRIFLVIRY